MTRLYTEFLTFLEEDTLNKLIDKVTSDFYNSVNENLLVEANSTLTNYYIAKANKMYDYITDTLSDFLSHEKSFWSYMKDKNTYCLVAPNFPIIVIQERKADRLAVYYPEAQLFIIYCLNNDKLSGNGILDIYNNKYRQAIVHEFLHYLQYNKANKDGYKLKNLHKIRRKEYKQIFRDKNITDKDKKFVEYFNRETELKAFTREIINRIKDKEKELLFLIGNNLTVESLRKALIEIISAIKKDDKTLDDFFKYLTTKNRRNVNNEIYQYIKDVLLSNKELYKELINKSNIKDYINKENNILKGK